MFTEAPFLSLLIFGFPFGVISIVCYFLCCADSTDQLDETEEYSDTDEEEDEHQYILNEANQNGTNEPEGTELQNNNNVQIDPDKIRMKPIKISKKTQ